jgi:hypothetical protein
MKTTEFLNTFDYNQNMGSMPKISYPYVFTQDKKGLSFEQRTLCDCSHYLYKNFNLNCISFSFIFFFSAQMEYYSEQIRSAVKTIQRMKKPDNTKTIVSVIAATGFVLYCIKKLVNRRIKNKQKDFGYEKIPVPEGAYYYLGTHFNRKKR